MRQREVIKHSSAIQITNSITLLQRRAWNVLLAYAYGQLGTQDRHQLPLGELVDALGITTRNDAHLRSLLRSLVTTHVEWNALGKDGAHDWGIMPMLAGVEMRQGVIVYTFGLLSERLHNPGIYARIKLSVQNKFTSKHALALYELLVDYLRVGRTPAMSVDTFRHLMGLGGGEYPAFKQLHQRVIRSAIDEINRVSDIEADVELRRESGTVVEVQFTCRATRASAAEAVAGGASGAIVPLGGPALLGGPAHLGPRVSGAARSTAGGSTTTTREASPRRRSGTGGAARTRADGTRPEGAGDPDDLVARLFNALSPLEQSAARTAAERAVDAEHPGASVHYRESLVQMHLRAVLGRDVAAAAPTPSRRRRGGGEG